MNFGVIVGKISHGLALAIGLESFFWIYKLYPATGWHTKNDLISSDICCGQHNYLHISSTLWNDFKINIFRFCQVTISGHRCKELINCVLISNS